MNVNPSVSQGAVIGRSWLASPRTALVLGVAAALSMVAGLVLSIFGARGGIALALLPFAIVGTVVSRRQPGNPVGPLLLLVTFAIVASDDAAQYDVLRYRLGYHGLPLGRVAVFLGTPGAWMWLVVFLPLPVALFPDGRLSPGWRRMLWGYLAVCAIFVATEWWQTAGGILARHLEVNSQGQLVSGMGGSSGGVATVLIVGSYLGFCVAWVLRLVLSYRRSTGDYRQQLKWLAVGGALAVSGLALVTSLNSVHSTVLRAIGGIGLVVSLLALPISLGVGILRYRLYEIDRLISRTLSYLIVTGLLAGVFVGIVVLATDVLPFSSPVAVAASTLAAAALFNPLRKRVQRLVDRRFNRSRYDTEATIATFTLRLRDALDPDAVRLELLTAVHTAVQPAHSTLWIKPTSSTS